MTLECSLAAGVNTFNDNNKKAILLNLKKQFNAWYIQNIFYIFILNLVIKVDNLLHVQRSYIYTSLR